MRSQIIDICREHKDLNPAISEKLIALGDTSTEELINIATDIELLNVDSVGGGYIPVIAAKELARRKEEKAIKPLLSVVADLDILDMVLEDFQNCITSLLTVDNFSEVIEVYDDVKYDTDFQTSIAIILSESKIKDERIFKILLNAFKNNPLHANMLADYGSSDAIPHLMEEFDSLKVDGENAFANMKIFEVEEAILRLGGTMTDFQKQKMEVACRAGDNLRQVFKNIGFAKDFAKEIEPLSTPAVSKKIGRNSPCLCGSGKKYKKCCLLN